MGGRIGAYRQVAPARERGLKSYDMPLVQGADIGRSREGAWIEIVAVDKSKVGDCGRSREGAWIEMYRQCVYRSTRYVAPARERGLKYVGYAYGD